MNQMRQYITSHDHTTHKLPINIYMYAYPNEYPHTLLRGYSASILLLVATCSCKTIKYSPNHEIKKNDKELEKRSVIYYNRFVALAFP